MSEEIFEYSTVIGYKDQRYPITQYVDSSFREIYSNYKYGVAFKNKNNMPRFAFRMFTLLVGLYGAGQKLWL